MTRKPDPTQAVTNAVLAERLDTLTKAVTDGFTGVHERQDKTNGKVIKANDDIISLQKEQAELKADFKYNRVIWYFLTVSVSVIIALASYIVLKGN